MRYVPDRIKHLGIISTRLCGTDGVSLESAKWERVFEQAGFICYYFAGELDRPPERSYLAKKAHFDHPEIREINRHCFGVTRRDRSVTSKIQQIKRELKGHLYQFVERFHIDALVVENAVTIPMNIPLGIAITEFLAETNMRAVAHHHDFYWERDVYAVNAVSDYLHMAFPPELPNIFHIVINSFAAEQLSFRTGISARIIPNVMDFEHPPPPPDDYAADVRQALGISDDELFILQPTRVVKRKGIEHAIELVYRLKRRGMKAKLVISHASGDEGYDYEQRLIEYSDMLGVQTLFESDIIKSKRGLTRDGRKIYTLADIYPHADLITYPSTYEGFGNAFLEAVYFRKPIVVNKYSIYTKDIKPRGFWAIELDGYVTREAVSKTVEILLNPELRNQIVEHNYDLGKKFFSYSVLRRRLRTFMLENYWLL